MKHFITLSCFLLLFAVLFFVVPQNSFGQAASDPHRKQKFENAKKLYDSAGNDDSPESALTKLTHALEVFREIGATDWQIVTLIRAGKICFHSDEMKTAGVLFDKAVELSKKSHNTKLESDAYKEIALLYYAYPILEQALDYFQRSLRLALATGNQDTASILLGIGNIYHDLGRNDQALAYYHRALRASRLARDLDDQGISLGALGSIYSSLGNERKAEQYLQMAISLNKKTGNKASLASNLGNLSSIQRHRGQLQKAFATLTAALAFRKEIRDPLAEAVLLLNLGTLHQEMNRHREALNCFTESLDIARTAGNVTAEAFSFRTLMYYWDELDNPYLAILYGKQSVNSYQILRRRVSNFDSDLQNSYRKTMENTYRRLASILMKAGRIPESEKVLNMLKDKEYASYAVRDDGGAALDASLSLSSDELKQIEDLERAGNTVTLTAQKYGDLERKKDSLPLGQALSEAEQQEFDRLKVQHDDAIATFDKFVSTLKVKVGQRDVRVASIESDTQGLLKRLGEARTVIISTIVGEDSLSLILTTSDIQKAYDVKIKAVELNELVAQVRTSLTNVRLDPRPAGKKLFDTLFPIALQRDLKNIKTDTIVWSLDGTLRYVPMAALWDGNSFLAERYANSILTLASRDKLGNASVSTSSWFAFGVGSSRPYDRFSALPAVPRELCSIIADPKKAEFCATQGEHQNGVLNGLILSDDEFTLSGFQNNVNKAPVVHIASHFSLNPGNETDSFLLLGGGSVRRFSMDDLRKTRLDNVDLLTLSACNTAMTPGDDAAGSEVEGFGALAMNQGARSVLAALWAVADESTSSFMSEFYRLKKANPLMSKAEAIRLAQKEMIDGKIKTTGQNGSCRSDNFVTPGKQNDFKCDPNAPFSHPYFWSPFVLIGNWR